MATTSRSTRGPRLGTQFRGKLAAAYGQRGVGPNSLWYVYSPRSQSDWVLRSDLEWDHFVLAESDPIIASCSYEPVQHSLPSGGRMLDVPVDAVVTYQDGRVEWRHIRFAGNKERAGDSQAALLLDERIGAAAHAGVTYTLWTDEPIRRNPLRLANWRRAIAWVAAARDRPLSPFQEELHRALRAEGTLTLAQVESMFGEASFGLYAAAAFTDLQRGKYVSDLDTMPLSRHTILQLQ